MGIAKKFINCPMLLCCKTRVRLFIFSFLSLQGKSEEEVSSAGEQLTSHKIYDGENTNKSFLSREALFFVFTVTHGSKKLTFSFPRILFQ
jgi:hypothetical protein